jgi:hypothetical protein
MFDGLELFSSVCGASAIDISAAAKKSLVWPRERA